MKSGPRRKKPKMKNISVISDIKRFESIQSKKFNNSLKQARQNIDKARTNAENSILELKKELVSEEKKILENAKTEALEEAKEIKSSFREKEAFLSKQFSDNRVRVRNLVLKELMV